MALGWSLSTYHKCSLLTFLLLLLLVTSFVYRGQFITEHTTCLQCAISSIISLHLATAVLFSSSSAIRFTAHRIVRIIGFYALSVCVFHLVLILYGAHISAAVAETLLLSLLLASLTVLPYLLFYKFDLGGAVRLWVLFEPSDDSEKLILHTSLATLLGTWVGAWPIPLDWDRPWQAWPITCTTGAMCGYCVGVLYNVIRRSYLNLMNKTCMKHKPAMPKHKGI